MDPAVPIEEVAGAVKELIAEGKMKAEDFPDLSTATYIKAPETSALDGVTFDANQPNAFLASFKIGLK